MTGKFTVRENDLVKIVVVLISVASAMSSSVLFSSMDILIDTMKYIALVVAILDIFLKCRAHPTLNYLFSVLLMCALILATSLLTWNFSFFLVCIILVLADNLKMDDFVRINLSITVCFAILNIGGWLLNLVVNLGFPVFYHVAEHRISFLYSHPNICSIKLAWGIIMYTWLKWDTLNKRRWLTCLILSILLYATTKSDACMVLIFYLFMILFRKIDIAQKAVIFFSKICFPLFALFSIVVSTWYVGSGILNDFSRAADQFFNRRLSMCYLAIRDNGISLIGQKVNYQHTWDSLFNYGNYTLDNLYVYMYVCIGVVYLFIIAIGFWKVGNYKNYKAALIVITFSLWAMIELHCLYLTNCFALLLLKGPVYKEKELT